MAQDPEGKEGTSRIRRAWEEVGERTPKERTQTRKETRLSDA